MEYIRSVRMTKDDLELIEACRTAVAASSMGVKPSAHQIMQKAIRRGLGAFFEGKQSTLDNKKHVPDPSCTGGLSAELENC
jgi:hypothetical protein